MKQVFDVPERGDIVLMTLPARGRRNEVGAGRPFVVLSPQAYNGRVGLALACPITTRVLGYPFEVGLPQGLPLEGVILADQAASLDWRELRAEKIASLPDPVVEETLGKLRALLA